jgi:hypothetical protein
MERFSRSTGPGDGLHKGGGTVPLRLVARVKGVSSEHTVALDQHTILGRSTVAEIETQRNSGFSSDDRADWRADVSFSESSEPEDESHSPLGRPLTAVFLLPERTLSCSAGKMTP